jgi:hypothetical protein
VVLAKEVLMVRIEFDTDNAAFVDDFEGEVSLILIKIARKIERNLYEGQVQDSNGNTVGYFEAIPGLTVKETV